jgi:hypothetical protein
MEAIPLEENKAKCCNNASSNMEMSYFETGIRSIPKCGAIDSECDQDHDSKKKSLRTTSCQRSGVNTKDLARIFKSSPVSTGHDGYCLHSKPGKKISCATSKHQA